MNAPLSRRVLQDGDELATRICACGVVHLYFGATRVEATPQAVIAMAESLQDLAHLLQRSAPGFDPINAGETAIGRDGNLIKGYFPA